MSENIQAILAARKSEVGDDPPDSNFFGLYRADNPHEAFVEFRFRDGIQCAFPYHSLSWINLDNSAGLIDMDFMGFVVSIQGRGLRKLFECIKHRKVSWIEEADTEMQDSAENLIYIASILVEPPSDFGGEEPSAED